MDQPINPPVLQSVHQLALPLCRRTSNFPCRGPEISCVPVRPSVRVQFPTSPPVPPIIAATAPVPTPTPRTRNRTVAMQAEPSQKAKRRDATNLLCLRLPKGDDGPNVPKTQYARKLKHEAVQLQPQGHHARKQSPNQAMVGKTQQAERYMLGKRRRGATLPGDARKKKSSRFNHPGLINTRCPHRPPARSSKGSRRLRKLRGRRRSRQEPASAA